VPGIAPPRVGHEMIELDPSFKSQNGDEVLRSIQEWIVQQPHSEKPMRQTTDVDKSRLAKETPPSPRVAHAEPSVDSARSSSPGSQAYLGEQANSSPTTTTELFLRKRVVRPVVGGLLVAIVLGAVWQTYSDNQTRTLIKSSMYRLTSSFGATMRGSISSTQSPLSDQAPQTPTAPSVSADEVTGLKQQLQALVNELAVMRRDVEQLSSKHEQLSRDIAAVQTTEQNVSEKVSSLTQPAASLTQSAPALPRPAPARVQPQKHVPRATHTETSKQPDAASLSATPPPTGTASLTEQPPRPPLPVPTAPETSSPLH
jgi:hypothetical protein